MKTHLLLSISIVALAAIASPASLRADTADANCELRKDGEVKQGKSGPCSFSQRQGNVGIDLRNGDRYDLSAADEANHYRDQHGNKVTRSFDGDNHIYKWPNKKIIVSFGSRASQSSAGGSSGELQDMVHGRWVGGEVADEMARRGYQSVRDDVVGSHVKSFYKGHGQCVAVTLDGKRRVDSIDTKAQSDCHR